MLNPKEIRKDFPIFDRGIVYLDNAATSQKPIQVIDALSDFYKNHNANVHRGIHTLSEEATKMYEEARAKVAGFIGARLPEEVIFTSNATDSVNMVAFSWGLDNLKSGDIVLAFESEHHSNLVPWQIVCKMTGATLKVLSVDGNGEIDLNELNTALNEKVKLIAVSHASNVLATIFPVKEICKMAGEVGAKVLVDGAQAIPNTKVNMQSLGCDFYAFSGHKMLGPTGIGVLWAKMEILENMSPYKFGGGMIKTVKTDSTTWASIPERFEAGTPNTADAVGLGVAIDYIEKIGMDNIREFEEEMNEYALEKLSEIAGLKILGPSDPKKRTGLVSFVIDGIHPHDIAAVLSEQNIAVRSGQHCTMPLHDKLGITASTRASYYIYNTKEDIDALAVGILKAKEILNG